MKNAYGVAIGIADGIEKRTGLPHANMRAALLPHAVAEMSLLAESLGGRRETVAGLSGAGDLQGPSPLAATACRASVSAWV